ncbi:serine hydrolase domain-containing protein [Polyangium sp. 15x6]|uniref:serine hydrolase domain-containing protein n=1 Tax=Polyangium sp. 15x6 TaxID=3042687 RepID=UPI00249B33C9|nr:serine hydrolase domain-containing protein [Polyangium sp. 15x6]MDI3290427.1 serine hydrolase domain-containing protein [Polyangium sp. 15x6]
MLERKTVLGLVGSAMALMAYPTDARAACDTANNAELSAFADRVEDRFNLHGGTQLAIVRKQPNGQFCEIMRNHGFAVSAADVSTHSTAISTMTFDIPMPIGSVSKTITAARVAEVLDAYNISPLSTIAAYIPSSMWSSRGPGVEYITFHQLLKHTSGMPGGSWNSVSGFTSWFTAGCDTDPVSGVCLDSGTPAYNNMGYELLGLLIANMTTNLPQEASDLGQSEIYTAGHLLDAYVRDNYLGWEAAYSGCYHTLSRSPFAYPNGAVSTTAGAQLGADFNTGCGTGGFSLTAYDTAKFFSKLYAGDILSPTAVDMVFQTGYGADGSGTTIGGTPFLQKGGQLPVSSVRYNSWFVFFKDSPGTALILSNNIYSGTSLDDIVDAWDETKLCADGVPAEKLGDEMWGCPGTVTYPNKDTLCGSETHVCTPDEWEDRRGTEAPEHIYWTDYGSTELGFHGSSGSCSARYLTDSPAGTTCGNSGNSPMRICSGTSDAEGNTCNWTGCKYQTSSNSNHWGGCVGNPTAGALCCANRPCADGSVEQTFSSGMVGCAGTVSYANRESLCGYRMHVCTAEEWNANRGVASPGHIYWVDNGASDLGYTGSGSNNCAAKATPTGTGCGDIDGAGKSKRPMRVCSGNSDAEGNSCTWTGCTYENETTPNFFGGCASNPSAGALCCYD